MFGEVVHEPHAQGVAGEEAFALHQELHRLGHALLVAEVELLQLVACLLLLGGDLTVFWRS